MTIARYILSCGLSNDELEDVCSKENFLMFDGDVPGNVDYWFTDESRIVFDGETYTEVV